MSRTQRVVVFTFAASVALLVAVLYSPRVPPKSINFIIRQLPSTNGFHQHYGVIVSNSLDTLVVSVFEEGFKKTKIETAYVTNGIWYFPKGGRSIGGGFGVIQPHQALGSTFEVPPDATAVKVGLFVTPLSWRGRLGWGILHSRRFRVLAPLGHFLLGRDTGVKAHSRTEWSDPYPVRTVDDDPENSNGRQ